MTGRGETTIYALSSAPGRAALAVVRISGPRAGAALTALGGKADRPRLARFARLTAPSSGALLDEALTLWFAGPASETGEDMAELHLHGSHAVIEAVLGELGRLDGLVPAGPGEFARRAFLNGKIDLTAVEGLADLVAAETEAQRRQALEQMAGGLAALYDGWRAELIGALAHVEAAIDFADEDVPAGLVGEARAVAAGLESRIAAHLADGRRGERLRDGFKVVVAGPPNAGKSSLVNALARREAAIVTPEPGTTRDVIDIALDLGGYPVVLTDTAGLRDGAGMVEAEGIRRAGERMAEADLVLWLRDAGAEYAPPIPAGMTTPAITVWTKCDLAVPEGSPAVSAVTGAGLAALVDSVAQCAADALEHGTGGPTLSRPRHRQAVERALEALARSRGHRESEPELVAEDLRHAATALGRITGRVDVEDLLDVIFGDLCIGK